MPRSLANRLLNRAVRFLDRWFPSVPAHNPFAASLDPELASRAPSSRAPSSRPSGANPPVIDLCFRLASRSPRRSIFIGLASLISTSWLSAQTVTNSFMDNDSTGWVFGGTGYTPNLTSGGADPSGQGWLRMTPNSTYLATYAYYGAAVDSRDTTIFASFEFTNWDDAGGGAGDGMTFFLFDGTKTFAVGANGGSMGYAQKTGVDGLNGGYMGLALDNYGNYSNPTEGRVGGPGFIPNAIAVRGPGNGTDGYEYIAGTGFGGTPPLDSELDFPSATSRPTAAADYRKVSITLSPGNQLSVQVQFGSGDPQEIYIADLSEFTRPETLKFGFTAGTGAAASYHELRNFSLSSVKAILWDNESADSLWGTGSNWYADGVPAAGADILLNNAFVTGSQSVDLGGATRSVRTLTLDAPFAYQLSNGTLNFDGAGNPGTLSLAASSVYGNAAHTVGANITTTGNLLIKNTTDSLLTLAGTVDNGGYRLSFDGSAPIAATGAISGAGSLYKFGPDDLVLSGNNTYAGGTVIQAGGLGLGHNSALGSGPLTVNGDTASLYASGGARTVANNVSLRSDLAIIGSENLNLSGTITNYGGNHTLKVDNTGTTTLSGNILLSESNTGRTLTVDNSGDTTISGIISNGGTGAGGLTKEGSGTVTLSGANTYTGATTINNGTLALGANDVLSNSTDVNLAGGTLLLNGFSDRVDDFTFGNAALDYGPTGNANYFMFQDNGATPAGTLTVLNWEEGSDRLAYRSNESVPSSFLDNIYFSGYGAGAEVLAGNQDQNIPGYGGATDWDFITPKASAWSVWDGGSGFGNLWSSGANWVGDVKPTSGTTLRVSFAGNTRLNPVMDANYTMNSLLFTNGAGSFTLSGNTGTRTITLAGTLPSVMQKSDNNQTINTRLSLSSTTIFDTIGAGDLTVSQRISGTGGINKFGTGGDLILSAANTYEGATTINQGVVNIQNSAALGATTEGTTVASGAALEVQGGINVAGETLSLSGTGVSNGGALRNVSDNNSWSGAVTLAGDTRINADAGTLTVSGAIGGSGRDLTVGGAGNVTLSGAIGTGAGSVTYDGTGTLTLSGSSANTFTGGFTLNSGSVDLNKTAGTTALAGPVLIGDGSGTDTLRLLAANQIADTAVVTLASSGVLNLNNNNETIAGLEATSGSASVQLGNGTLTVNSFANSSFAGVISDGAGTGALVKTGNNTLSLSGANTYDGATTVSQGVLNIRNDSALGSASAGTTVASGATLQIQDSITVSGEALTISGSGVSDTGALRNMLGNNTWTGNLALGAAATIASDSGTLNLNGTVNNAGHLLTVAGDGNTTINGALTGAGGLAKTGDGTLTLAGANSFTGNITISGGTLLLGGDHRIPNSVNMTLAGGTFATGGYDDTLGTLTLSANSTINLGSGSSFLNFGDSSAQSWIADTYLSINNWSGSSSGGGTDRIFFGSTTAGLTSSQLSRIVFVDPFGPGTGLYPAGILSTGEIVPVPEPATLACIGLLALVIGYRERDRLAALLRAAGATRTA